MWDDKERQTKTFFGIIWTKNSLQLHTNSESIAAIDQGVGQLFYGIGDIFGIARDFIRFKRTCLRRDYTRQLEYQTGQAHLAQSGQKALTFEASPQDYTEHGSAWDTNKTNGWDAHDANAWDTNETSASPNWPSSPPNKESIFVPNQWIPMPVSYR